MSCTCHICVSACRRIPGRFAPLEALRAIRAGYATRMMLVANGTAKTGIFGVLMPRSIVDPAADALLQGGVDPHRRVGTWEASGQCVFLDGARCSIHDSGFKPVECRVAYICKKIDCKDSEDTDPWKTSVGRLVVSIWQRELKDPAPAARARVQARRASL